MSDDCIVLLCQQCMQGIFFVTHIYDIHILAYVNTLNDIYIKCITFQYVFL